MKAARLGLLLAISVLTVVAEQDAEMHEWMATSDKAMAVLKKLEQKTGPEAVRAAERLGGIYEDMIGFWRQKNLRQAVKWSEQGKTAALLLAAAAHAGDTEKAASAFKELSDTCTPCHNAHREGLPEGKYRIKFDRPTPAPKPAAAKH